MVTFESHSGEKSLVPTLLGTLVLRVNGRLIKFYIRKISARSACFRHTTINFSVLVNDAEKI